MKTELEEISRPSNSSLCLMVNPNLSDFFFWHFHPEYELVYIDGASGTRHVGEHISRFEGSDLVLIGSYIPHLNFDYGVKTPYEKMVVHIRPDFLQAAHITAPELQAIHELFQLSCHGIAFGETAKALLGTRIKQLDTHATFELFLELLSILKALMDSPDKVLLHDKPVKNQFTQKDQERLRRVFELIDRNYQRKLEVREAAQLTFLSEAAFCRYFKKMTRLTFTEFVNHYRIDKAKKLLLHDRNVTETCFDCGFESLSYFNRTFKKITGENPLSFKKGHRSTS
ncbi:helix-turn-helix domain-containing protein [Aquiflexum sp.]|uniref:helix-turn-helix domain-containing protein n=1 Tax=Aquiflexum sp. TaxID=1872584 RepID=UPI0035931848